ncbi:MAG: serine hydroxymethyltransferase [Firmicutes bacterium]|nr:serine hydroxymethyltransferase [Bacillota bacterium]
MSLIQKLIKQEERRQRGEINLIASENISSKAVQAAVGSPLAHKYAEGYPGKRYYGGCEVVDQVENHAIELLKKIYGCDHANVQPHSGSSANMGVYMALLKPGDTVLGMDLDSGGHLTHGSPVNFSGQLYKFIPYGLDENGVLDYAEFEKLAKKHKPKMITVGASTYSLIIDYERMAKVAKEVGAIYMVDMAHYAGLVAGGQHPNPCQWADVVTSTTHKTLRGTRGGIILCKEEHAKAIDKAIFPGIQGGPLMNEIAGKAVAFEEALTPAYKVYIQKVIQNADYLCKRLQEHGLKIISGGTQTHMFMVDVRDSGKSGLEIRNELMKHNIVVNQNRIAGDQRSAMQASGIRIGTPFITNFKKVDFRALDELAAVIAAVCQNRPVPPMKLLPKIFKA